MTQITQITQITQFLSVSTMTQITQIAQISQFFRTSKPWHPRASLFKVAEVFANDRDKRSDHPMIPTSRLRTTFS